MTPGDAKEDAKEFSQEENPPYLLLGVSGALAVNSFSLDAHWCVSAPLTEPGRR